MPTSPLQLLLEAMQKGALILTPTKHLSHVLIQHFFKDAFQTIQPKPHCFPYQTFLHVCYDLLLQQETRTPHPILLSHTQSKLLWEKSAQSLPQYIDVSSGLYDATFSAWQLSKTWHLSLTHPLFEHSPQTQLFQQLALQYDTQLQTEDFLTEQTLIPYLSNFSLQLPYKHIIFACFDDFSPQQLAFQTFLAQQGVHVTPFDLSSQQEEDLSKQENTSAKCTQYTATNEQSELEALYEWLNSSQRQFPVAVLVPNLDQQGRRLKRWFQFHFPNTSIHFSLGQPLAEYPLVNHALSLLLLSQDELTIEQAKLLLHSAFILGNDSEKIARSKFLIHDSALQARFITSTHFCNAIKQTCPILEHLLISMTPYPDQASPSEWADLFIKRLITFGFPGPHPLISETYQAYQRLLDLLNTFKELSFIQPELSQREALHYFKQLAQQSLFQPQQSSDSPIHVLGLLEAAGSPYEDIWIMGLTDQNFPNQVLPTPFIPIELQRHLHMPHTDLNQEFHLTQLRLARFQHASSTLVLSYPKMTQDVINRPSPLILHYPNYHPTFDGPKPNLQHLENYNDPTHLPIHPDEQLHQGTQLLSEQAKCGFRALASMRLISKTIEPASSGLNAKSRGILLHKTLELFWLQIKNQKKLQTLDETSLQQTIEQAIQQAMSSLKETAFLAQPIFQLEQERIQKLIFATFNWEKTRPAYEVESLESKHSIQLGPLTFQIRLDRIDILSPEEKWVIDYKTSLPSPLPWYQEDSLEPQILLYALIEPHIKTILFHELKKGQSLIKGISAHAYPELPLSSPKENQSWEGLRAQWKTYLTQLAQSFFDGHCEAKPKTETLCHTCSYQSLCRLPLKQRNHVEL
jgi:ATP-dependent helicase/nuclease subunit B